MIAETRVATQPNDPIAAPLQGSSQAPEPEGFADAMRQACPETAAPAESEPERTGNAETQANSPPEAAEAAASTEGGTSSSGTVALTKAGKPTQHGATVNHRAKHALSELRKGNHEQDISKDPSATASSVPVATASQGQAAPATAVPLAKAVMQDSARISDAVSSGSVAVQTATPTVAGPSSSEHRPEKADAGAGDAEATGVSVQELPADATAQASLPAPAEAGGRMPTESSALVSAGATMQVPAAAREAGLPSAVQPASPQPATHTAADWSVQRYEAPTANRLEIGVAGGAFGWLSVRAEVNATGDVHAYLRGSSAAAELELQAQTTALQSFLGTQELKVHAVHVEASQPMVWAGSAGNGDAQQRSAYDGDAEDRKRNADGHGSMAPIVKRLDTLRSIGLPRSGSGGWLSVMA